MLKTSAGLVTAALSLSAASTDAAVYNSGVTLGNYVDNQRLLSAWTEPAGDSNRYGAEIGLAIDGSLVLTPTVYTVGIGHVWYSVTHGTAVDPAFATTAPVFLNAFLPSVRGSVQMTPGTPFLLGFWLDRTQDQIPGAGDRFGWAELEYTSSSGLILRDSAIEGTGAGIIAGTTIAVPEPSILCPALASLVCCMSRRRHAQERPCVTPAP